MKRVIWMIISVFLLLPLSGCQPVQRDEKNILEKITVVVGIVPEAAFVEKVAGDLVDVVTLIPPGNSPTNYQPTVSEMQALSNADIYFTLQMPTEESNILPKISGFNENIVIVNLRDAVSEVYPLRNMNSCCTHIENEHEETAVDPHVWLSPKRVIAMVQAIGDELSTIDEQNRETYRQNVQSYVTEIETLDSEIKNDMEYLGDKSFLIYHGAYGYFADDYGLKMISIETQGKQATAVEIGVVIEYARDNNIKTVFYQEEFDDSQAQTIAEEIGGRVVSVSPLSFDYIEELRDFTNALAGGSMLE